MNPNVERTTYPRAPLPCPLVLSCHRLPASLVAHLVSRWPEKMRRRSVCPDGERRDLIHADPPL